MDSLNQDAPTVQRARLGTLWGGQEVEASFVPKNRIFFFTVVFDCLNYRYVLRVLICQYEYPNTHNKFRHIYMFY
jgi:hypothetical protein